MNKNEKQEFDYRQGHRERLREKFRKNGANTFTECEFLEMLLFYAIPRKDTKPIAHMLLNKFGSLKSVMSSSEQQLIDAGLSKSAAFYLSFIKDFELFLTHQREARKQFVNYSSIGKYMCSALKHSETEKMFVVLMDKRNRLIDEAYLGLGDFKSVKIDYRQLTELCLSRKAAKVVIAHNHPSGIVHSSAEDDMATRQIESLLNGIGVELYEHFVVSDDKYYGINGAPANNRRYFGDC